MTTRHDMLVELVTNQINSIEQMIRDDEYQDVHTWLHPILLRELKLDYADWSDDDLETYYIEDCFGKDLSQETSNRRPVSKPSSMELSEVPSVYSVSDEKSLAEVASTIHRLAYGQAPLPGLKPEAEVRISVRHLLKLVYGQRSIG